MDYGKSSLSVVASPFSGHAARRVGGRKNGFEELKSKETRILFSSPCGRKRRLDARGAEEPPTYGGDVLAAGHRDERQCPHGRQRSPQPAERAGGDGLLQYEGGQEERGKNHVAREHPAQERGRGADVEDVAGGAAFHLGDGHGQPCGEGQAHGDAVALLGFQLAVALACGQGKDMTAVSEHGDAGEGFVEATVYDKFHIAYRLTYDLCFNM